MAAPTTVIVGVPNWPSARVTAQIIAQVLEARYDVEVRLRPIGTVELFDAIDRGEVDVHPEVWLPNLQRFVEIYRDERGTMQLAPNGTEARQSLCTTQATVETTGLDQVSDLADPAMARHFDTDGDGRGEMWIGDREWSSTRIERVRARSYGYGETMLLLTMPEDLAMASVDVAAATGAPIVFYCYAPHHVFALHDVVVLDEPAHDPSTWHIVQAEDDPAWLDRSRAGSAWQPSTFRVGYATDFALDHPALAAFLDKVQLTEAEAERVTYAVHVEGRAPHEVAAGWIAQNRAKLAGWTR